MRPQFELAEHLVRGERGGWIGIVLPNKWRKVRMLARFPT
jgi:hypothetical protein